jgi:hypothetical protein
VDARESVAPDEARAFRLRVVDQQIARLTTRKDEILDPLDADERAIAEAGIGAELTPTLQRLHRYESACSRRFSKALNYFADRDRKRKPAPDDTLRAPEPRPTPPPAPAPAPAPVRAPRAAPGPHDSDRLVSSTRPQPVLPGDALLDEPRSPNRRERRRLAKLQRQA